MPCGDAFGPQRGATARGRSCAACPRSQGFQVRQSVGGFGRAIEWGRARACSGNFQRCIMSNRGFLPCTRCTERSKERPHEEQRAPESCDACDPSLLSHARLVTNVSHNVSASMRLTMAAACVACAAAGCGPESRRGLAFASSPAPCPATLSTASHRRSAPRVCGPRLRPVSSTQVSETARSAASWWQGPSREDAQEMCKLLELDTAEMERTLPGSATRAGRVITYSRKVFIPLTRLCRDRCSYCTFASHEGVDHPSHEGPPSAYLSKAQVLDIAREGERNGCTEALFTLGDR